MHPSVRDVAPGFQARFEGRVLWPYLDCKGLLTIGVGCLIDPPRAALELPWVFTDGTDAPRAEVLAQLQALKQQPRLAQYAAQSQTVAAATRIRLTDAGVDALCLERLLAAQAFMKARYFPGWETWPADAQLAALSLAWAVGPGWPGIFKTCAAACQAGAWVNAALECDINAKGNPGVIPRSAAQRLCFSNAAVVADGNGLVGTVYWPTSPLMVAGRPDA